MKKVLPYIALHVVILIYSFSGICSKTAASKDFLSFEWLLFYGLVLLILAFYAIVWQQILKKLPLNVAYANKAITVIWGMLLGCIVFGETVNVPRIIGGILILAGIILMSPAGKSKDREKKGNE